MKKTTLSLTLISVLTVSFFCGTIVQPVKSQSLANIDINPDGSITGTTKIQQNGNVYTLTDNLNNLPVEILCDNIVFDGEGFTLQGPGGYPTPAAINLSCTNVVIRNFSISGWEVGILGNNKNNTIAENNVTGNERDIAIYANNYNIIGNYLADSDYAIRIIGNNDIIFQNVVENSGFAFWITNSSDIIITANNITSSNPNVFDTDFGGFSVYHNNFLNTNQNMGILLTDPNASTVTLPPWDNGYPSGGNYWSDYTIIYPNATEIGNSGIGNTPYVVSFSPNVVDRYPLLSPINISQAILELPLPSSSPSPSPTMSPSNPTPSPSIPELQSWIILTLFTVTTIGLALLLFGKKNKNIEEAEG
jgi:hypothetical protein